MADEPQRYPNHDPARADLLVCPLSGKPILRAKDAAAGQDHAREFDLQPAVERDLQRGGPAKIWIAKDLA